MSNLPINEKNGVLVVDSRLVAQELGVNHGDWFRNVLIKYRQEIEADFGVYRFENGKPVKGSRGGRPEQFVYLTEEQATVLMTYSRNTEQVRRCKRQLVKAFTEAKKIIKQVIPAQAQEIEKLKLELEVARAQRGAAEAQQKLLAASQALAIINPGLPALVLGRPDAVLTKTEVIEKTVLVNSQGRSIATYQGISKTKLAKRYGMKRASEVVDWLRSIGQEDILQSGLTATPCQYIPWSEVKKLDKLWASRRGTRQFLIGE